MTILKKDTSSAKPEKPSPSPPPDLLGKKSSALARELRKDKFFSRLQRMPREERIKAGETLANKRVFGDYVGREDSLKIKSLENELRKPGSSSDARIKEIGRTVRGKYGRHKAKILADIVKEKYLGKK